MLNWASSVQNVCTFVCMSEVAMLWVIISFLMVPRSGEGLADGYKHRLMEFERFERQFKECVSSAAIRTKFEQHHKQGVAVVSDLEQLLELEEKQIHNNRSVIRYRILTAWGRLSHILTALGCLSHILTALGRLSYPHCLGTFISYPHCLGTFISYPHCLGTFISYPHCLGTFIVSSLPRDVYRILTAFNKAAH